MTSVLVLPEKTGNFALPVSRGLKVLLLTWQNTLIILPFQILLVLEPSSPAAGTALPAVHAALLLAAALAKAFLLAGPLSVTLAFTFHLFAVSLALVGLLRPVHLAVLLLRQLAVAIAVEIGEGAVAEFILSDEAVAVQVALREAGAVAGLLPGLSLSSIYREEKGKPKREY